MRKYHFYFSSFKSLSSSQLEAIFSLRQRVFIIEQECLFEDIDGFDSKADHLLFFDDDQLDGYLRVLGPGIKFENTSSIGRIVVEKKYRGEKLGQQLIANGIEKCFLLYPDCSITIEAQAHLSSYYNKFGFTSSSNTYIVDGIPHLLMVLDK